MLRSRAIRTLDPEEALRYYEHIEEPNKPWPCGLRDNDRWSTKMSLANYNKTKVLFSKEIADLCRRLSLSVCYTAEREKAIKLDFNQWQ